MLFKHESKPKEIKHIEYIEYMYLWAIYWEYKKKFVTKANNYKSTQQNFMNKDTVPKQSLNQKRFHEHYYSGRHDGLEYWVITLI